MRARLGLLEAVDYAVTAPVFDAVLTLLPESQVDYTSFFRHLAPPPKVTPTPPVACSATAPHRRLGAAVGRWTATPTE